MNTLGYVARQFDVLASSSKSKDPKTPDRKPPRVPRVASWSTKSFLFPPSPPRSSPKRSHSSPAFHQHSPLSSCSTTDVSLPTPSTSAAAPTTSPTTTPPTLFPTTRSKPPQPHNHVESVIDRIFFIRFFLLVWDHLKSAWSSLLSLLHECRSGNLTIPVPVPVPLLEQIHEKSPSLLDQSVPIQPPSISISVDGTISVSVSTSTTGPPAHTPAAPPSTSPTTTASPQQPRKTPFHLQKTLVLDLDETLIHSTSRPMSLQSSGSWLSVNGSGLLSLGSFGRSNKGAGHMVEVVLGNRSTIYHVYKRPFVDFFLRTVCIFLASKERGCSFRYVLFFYLSRYRAGIHSLYSPPRCKNMPTLLSIG